MAIYRAAELCAAGHTAKVIVRYIRPGLKHAIVQLEDGTIEDPSKRLGMGRKSKG